MAENWREMAKRLRANQEKNLRDYARQKEKNNRRIQQLNELQDLQEAALKAGRGRR